MDKQPEARTAHAILASSKKRKFSDAEMAEIKRLHNAGWSYNRLMGKFNISSTGTMSYIINNKYATKSPA